MLTIPTGGHWLPESDRVAHVRAPRCDATRRIEPSLVVVHTTDGALRRGSSVEWFCDPKCKTSAHIVVERDGTVVQMVAFDVKADHCGDSTYNGRRYCNGFALGIEVVNPGPLVDNRDGTASPLWGRKTRFNVGEYGIVERQKAGVWPAASWMPWTPEQTAAVAGLVAALAARYPITAVVGHDEIAEPRGRKTDPGPLVPWDEIRRPLQTRVSVRASVPAGDDLKAAQARLAWLGYALGMADGHWGPRTRSALRDFQDQAALPVTGDLNAATRQRLFADDAPHMPTGSRDEWTVTDIRKAGSSQARAGVWTRIKAAALAALGLGSLAPEIADAVPDAGAAIGLVDRFLPTLERLAASPIAPYAVGITLAGGVFWLAGRRQEQQRLTAAQRGEHLGV